MAKLDRYQQEQATKARLIEQLSRHALDNLDNLTQDDIKMLLITVREKSQDIQRSICRNDEEYKIKLWQDDIPANLVPGSDKNRKRIQDWKNSDIFC